MENPVLDLCTHHRVADGEDGYLRMFFSHQVDVIEDVSDVVVDRLDVNSVPIALSVSDCRQKEKKTSLQL